ncbi:hypothetical protein ECDEC7B_5426 [Escherichia coli DEC7B]|nr:hypothetical protein ECDEC7B_5426 [Escherichia coli DEC7B]
MIWQLEFTDKNTLQETRGGSFRRYPLILWITVLPPLSELTPLAAVERPSVASQ